MKNPKVPLLEKYREICDRPYKPVGSSGGFYMCGEKSKDYMDALREAGVKARICRGRYLGRVIDEKLRGHAWVEFWDEAKKQWINADPTLTDHAGWSAKDNRKYYKCDTYIDSDGIKFDYEETIRGDNG